RGGESGGDGARAAPDHRIGGQPPRHLCQGVGGLHRGVPPHALVTRLAKWRYSASTGLFSAVHCAFGSSGGTAANSARVYGCLGVAKTSSVRPCSTISPRYMVRTRLHK